MRSRLKEREREREREVCAAVCVCVCVCGSAGTRVYLALVCRKLSRVCNLYQAGATWSSWLSLSSCYLASCCLLADCLLAELLVQVALRGLVLALVGDELSVPQYKSCYLASC